jgi:hypothetical protein
LLREYREGLLRPAIASRHRLTPVEVDAVLTELVANARWREPASEPGAPDPGDNHLWALLAQRDVMLVTGDRLLLEPPPAPASVLSARSFLELFDS